ERDDDLRDDRLPAAHQLRGQPRRTRARRERRAAARPARSRDMTATTTSIAAPVLIMAGGTGGHIFPGIAIAQALRERDVPVLWLGSAGGLETRLVPQAGIAIETIAISG